MSVRHWVMGAAIVCMPMVAVQAQQAAPECTTGSLQLRDVCQLSRDLFNYMAPQLGTAVAGGNATLGQGGTLGGWGHFTVGVRMNLVAGSYPQMNQVTPNPTGLPAPRDIATKDNQPVPMPAVDVAAGVFKGIPLGLTNVGGVDVLLNLSYIPNVSSDGFSLSTPKASMNYGYGVRVGLLQESLLIPGVSFTYMNRSLPTVTVVSTSAAGATQDSLMLDRFSVKTGAWRFVVSKNLLFFGLAAGVGQDSYTEKAGISAVMQYLSGNYVSGPYNVKQNMTRTNMFVDATFNLLLLKVVGEIGQASGGSVPTYNNFSTAANASRLYGSLGLRLNF